MIPLIYIVLKNKTDLRSSQFNHKDGNAINENFEVNYYGTVTIHGFGRTIREGLPNTQAVLAHLYVLSDMHLIK